MNRLGYVLGCNGYVGQALVKELLSQGVKVIGIGTSPYSGYISPNDSNKGRYTYVSLYKKNIHVLKDILANTNDNFSRSVFFNLAWSGITSLTNGDIQDQFKNITLSTEAIKVASHIGCDAFIHIGSTQECYLANYLNEDWKLEKKSFENEFLSWNSLSFFQAGLAPAHIGEDQDLIPILKHMGLVQIVLPIHGKGHLATDSKFFSEVPEC